jgi:hypothetical protein
VTRPLLLAALPLLFTTITLAQPPAATQPARELTTKAYDVTDLLSRVPDFSPGTMPGEHVPPAPKGAPAAERKPTRQELSDQLVQWLLASSDARDWNVDGVQARESFGSLVVTAPLRLHEQIATLIDRARAARGRQITVEARILALDARTVDKLPDALRGKLADAAFPFAARAVAPSDDDTAALITAAGAGAGNTTMTAPRVTLFDGQRAYVIVATSRAYVSGYRLSDASTKEKPLVEPIVSVAEAGLWLDARASLDAADAKHIAVELHLTSSQLLSLVPAEWHAPPELKGLRDKDGNEPQFVQQPTMDVVKAERLCVAASGQTLLLALRPEPGHAHPGGADRDPPLTRVLLLKATGIERHEVRQDARNSDDRNSDDAPAQFARRGEPSGG